MVYQEKEASLCGAAGVIRTAQLSLRSDSGLDPSCQSLMSLYKIKVQVRLNSHLDTLDFLLGGSHFN